MALEGDLPLSAGAGAFSPEFAAALRDIAKLEVELALQDQKYGRSDRGTGSEAIGAILKQYRTEAGLSQRELAEKTKLHSTTIGKIETGERGMSLETFCKIAKQFKMYFAGDIINEIAPDE